MKLPLFWIDAFTSRVFGGNPAGVVPLDAWLPDQVLQKVAFEHGLSETAFFVPLDEGRFQLRWFTPKKEVDLCGHATLATAFALFSELGWAQEEISFETRSGTLKALRRENGLVELDFPARGPRAAVDERVSSVVLSSLGVSPAGLFLGEGSTNYLAVFRDTETVCRLTPNFNLLASLGDVRVIITAPGEDCDFVSRFFAPGVGIPEDPVTGSAHCTLVPYWSGVLGKTRLHARQVSERGGELFCELAGSRVLMGGNCALYLRGEISI